MPSVLLRVQGLRRDTQAIAGRLLRILLIRFGALPSGPNGRAAPLNATSLALLVRSVRMLRRSLVAAKLAVALGLCRREHVERRQMIFEMGSAKRAGGRADRARRGLQARRRHRLVCELPVQVRL